ncbi:MAG: RnfABCDGE type electron transport complex subunit D [Tannerellaceae bacterium]|nr:RnfABCDGE type electron transport complex subunit D [Tannerellaceae bacterium]
MLYVSPSPHIHSGDSVSKNMLNVLFALIPAFFVALYYYGLGFLIVSTLSVAACVVVEWLIQKFLLRIPTSISDGSAILTGVLLAFNLPSNLPPWIVIIGAIAAIAIAKMPFGGLGNNIFNPALVGRIFLLISFPAQMTSYPAPSPLSLSYTDAISSPTILSLLSAYGTPALPSPSLAANLLPPHTAGSLGLVGGLALLAGGIFLLLRKTISWHIPISTLATVLAFTAIFHAIDPLTYAHPLIHLFSGGLLLGAIFMATDYVTSPMTPAGMLLYGFAIGLLTAIIRLFGAYPEGMAFAILIMNAFTPLINSYTKPKPFGLR